MLQSFYGKSTSFVLLLIFICPFNKSNCQVQPQQLENLKAFTKLYGYIRFFHPSDEASKIDWNKFAVYGVEKVKNAKDYEELKEILKELFFPIAPTIQIYLSNEKPKDISGIFPRDTAGLKIVAWQHLGVGLSGKSNIYKSIRDYSDSELMDENQLKYSYFPTSRLDQTIIQRKKLFKKYPEKENLFKEELLRNLFCSVPLTLYHDGATTVGTNNSYRFQPLFDSVNVIEIKSKTVNDQFVQLANVVITWNVLQHFYPYFDVVNIEWGKVLIESLSNALNNKTSNQFYDTLRKMVAKLQDGHSFVTWEFKGPNGGLPIRVDYIENQVVITSTEDSYFKKGDIIKSINGKCAKNLLKEIEMLEPGPRQLKRYLGLISIDFGDPGSSVRLELVRDRNVIAIEKQRETKEEDFFRNSLFEFDYPGIKKFDGGIYYVNLLTIDENEFSDSLNQLATANGIIFDFRWTGKRKVNYKSFDRLKLLEHLISCEIESPKWNVPTIIYPNRKNFDFYQSHWTLKPSYPHFSSQIIFICDPNVISSMETFMAIVEEHKLGEIVGGVTAGTNGNTNVIDLPGGFEVMFTGMKVLKPDGSQHHLIGIQPTYPVQRAIKAVKEGRDEYLEKAIEVIKTKIKK